jgi:hypothetical protein
VKNVKAQLVMAAHANVGLPVKWVAIIFVGNMLKNGVNPKGALERNFPSIARSLVLNLENV